MDNVYRIGELAEKVGVTKRTIHYYVGKGLIPPPEGAGVGTLYTEEHHIKLLLIKKLQERFLPLEQIRLRLSNLYIAESRKMLKELIRLDGQADWKMIPDESKRMKSDTFKVSLPYLQFNESNAMQYIKLELGHGIELNYPVETNTKHEEVIKSIVRYAKKLLQEV